MYYPAIFLISLFHSLSPSFVRTCRLRYRVNLEFFLVIAIVAVAVVLAVKSYLPLVKTAQLTHALGRTFIETRADVMAYYAIEGHWPEDNMALQRFGGYGSGPKSPDPYIQEAIVENGAIHLHFSNALAGKVLTMRPGLPANGFESVIWVSGNQRAVDDWAVVGENRTTFDYRYLMRSLW